MSDADDVLAHSEDEGEWDEQPVVVERRPTGSQVLSVRVPDDLAALLFAEAEREGVRLSAIVRRALSEYLRPRSWDVIGLKVSERVRFRDVGWSYETLNPVVTTGDLPPLRAAV